MAAGDLGGTRRRKRRKRRRKGPDPVKVALQSVAHGISALAPTMTARTHWPGQADNDVALEAELGAYVSFYDPASSPSRKAGVMWVIISLGHESEG